MRCAVGIDIGGTSIQAGIVNEAGRLIAQSSIRTLARERSGDEIAAAILEQIRAFGAAVPSHSCEAIGIGCPGIIDPEKGTLIFAGNIPLSGFPLRDYFSGQRGIPVHLCNDADAAALAEVRIGAGKGARSAVMLTLGTGIGSSLILGGRIYTGFNGQGCEFGHTVIHAGGELCSCGRRGCMEVYCAAPALRRRTREMIEHCPDSILAKMVRKEGKIGGRTAFDAADAGCPYARRLIAAYIEDCAEGIANVINGLFPEMVILGGGVSRQGESFRAETERLCHEKCLHPQGLAKTRVVLAALGTKAGMIGAGLHALDRESAKL